MTKDEALRLVEEAANANPGSLRGSETLEQISWDSLASVSFVGLVDEKVGRQVDAKILAKCKTVPELINLIVE